MIGDSGSFFFTINSPLDVPEPQKKEQLKPVMKNRFLLFSLYSNPYIHAGLFFEIE